jgi:hypothetical protein
LTSPSSRKEERKIAMTLLQESLFHQKFSKVCVSFENDFLQ